MNFLSTSAQTPAEKIDKNFLDYVHPRTVKYMKNNFDLTPDDLRRLYIKGGHITEENRLKLVDMLSDTDFNVGTHQLLKIQAERGSAPTYFYKYCYDKTQSPFKAVLGITCSGKFCYYSLNLNKC